MPFVKKLFIFTLGFLVSLFSLYSGYQPINNFPLFPKVEEAKASPGTQIKTVEFYIHQFAPDPVSTTTASTIASGNGIKNTAWPTSCGDVNDASVAINLPESGIVIRKAWVEYFTVIDQLANSTNEMRFCRGGATSTPTTTSFTNIRAVDSLEDMPVELLQDVTSQIAAGQNTYYFNARLTTSIRWSDSAKLYITYEYDDTSPTQLNSVKYFVGCASAQQAAGDRDTYTVNPQIPESNVTVTQSFIEYWGEPSGGDVGDPIIFAGFNSVDASLAAGQDEAQRTSHEFRTLWNTTTTVSLNTSSTIDLVNNNDEINLKCAEWNINYTYDAAASATQLRTVRYGIGQDIDTLDTTQETLGARAINLPDLTSPSTNVRSAWLHYLTEPDAAATLTPQVNITGAAAPSTGAAFTMAFAANTGFIHVLFDIKTFFNAEWANGDTLTAQGACSVAGACDIPSADFFVTYAYATNQTAGIKTVTYFAAQDIDQNTAGTAFTTTTLSTFIPETGTITFRNGGTRAVLLAGASANAMDNTVTIDSVVAGTDTVTAQGGGNAEEHEHRVLLVSASGGQLTNASQSGITVTLNHTQAAHLSGAITFTTYEYPLPVTYEQSAYKWYANANSATPGAELTAGVQDASTTLSAAGGAFRLRMLLHVGVATSSAGLDNFKLQHASTTPGNCGPAFYSSSAFVDVATSTGEVRYNDNAGVANGSLVTSTSTDPTHGGDSRVNQTYVEQNNFTVTSTVGAGADGKWDFSLIDAAAPAATTYCFRVVRSNNTFIATSTSSKIPEIKTFAANSAPTVSGAVLNGASAIILTPNATTTITAVASTTDAEGPGDIRFATSTIYRSGVGVSCAADNLNCYQLASSSCSFADATSTVRCTAQIYYFAQATDASSSFAAQNWLSRITVTDAAGAAGSSTSSGVELNTLLAIDVTPTTTSYGTVNPLSNTSGTNQTVTVKNAGNSSTSLKLSGTALTLGSNSIATSSQHYATSTFTFGGAEQLLSDVATAVSGFLIARPPFTSWATTTALPSTLSAHSAVANNGFVYTTGGTPPNLGATSTVFYAPINATGSIGTWAATTAMLTPLQDHAAVVYNNFLYTVGGEATSTDASATSTVFYAPINATGSIGTWATTTALPTSTSLHAAVAYNGYLYQIGGRGKDSQTTSTVRFALINATGSIGSWTDTTALPKETDTHAAAVSNAFLYVVGGIDNLVNPTSTVWVAPINATGSLGTWTKTASLPSSTLDNDARIGSGLIYVAGGLDAAFNATSTVIYAPITSSGALDSWSNIQALPTTLADYSSIVNNGYLYVIGGCTDVAPTPCTDTSTVLYAPIASRNTYWGIEVLAGRPTGTYSGINTFTAVFEP